MAIYRGEPVPTGITFSRGAAATAEGVANAAKNRIINNVQTDKSGRAVKGSVSKGQDVSGQLIKADPMEAENVVKEASEFNALPNPFPQPIDTTQPSPTTISATPYTSQYFTKKPGDANPNQVYNDRGEPVSYDQYIQQGGAKDFSNVIKQGLAQAQALGPAPQDAGDARGIIDGLLEGIPQPEKPPLEVDNFLQTNPIVQSSLQELTEFLSPASTRKELEQSMKKIVAGQREAAKLNLELMNVQRVMEGTDQDIRDEVEKVGGFATESQVQALTVGRNKTLLKRAALIQDQLNYIKDVIQSDMTMYGFQKDMAQQEFQQRSFLLNYKQQNDQFMYKATQDAITRNLELLGADGLYNATQGDPVKISRLERAMNMPAGSLAVAAQQAAVERTRKADMDALEMSLKEAQIADIYNDLSTSDRNTEVVDIGGRKVLVDSDTGETISVIGDDLPQAPADPISQNQTKDKILTINDLITDGFKGIVAPNRLRTWNIANLFNAEQNTVIGKIDQLTKDLTLDKLINAKAQGATFGALSDAELRLLADSATRINSWAVRDDKGNVKFYKISPTEFKKELDRIQNYAIMDFVRKGGKAEEVGLKQMPNGNYVKANSDGSIEEFDAQELGFNQAGKPQASAGKKPYLKTLGAITGLDGSPLWKYGLDIDLKKGDPVRSPITGKVIAAANNGGFGKQVKIQDAQGRVWALSHLDGFNVKPGQTINAGMLVGKGGNTGNVIKMGGGDGSHLDMTVYVNGKPIAARQVKSLLDKIMV